MKRRGNCTDKNVEFFRFKSKGQATSVDLFVGIVMFLATFSILIKSYVNLTEDHEFITSDLSQQSQIVSDLLLSEGYPLDWDQTNVVQSGLLSDGRINVTKLDNFALIDYDEAKNLFRLRYEFMFYFLNQTDELQVNGKTYFGKPGVTKANIMGSENPRNLMKVNRIVVLNSQVVRMVIYVWD